MNPGGGTEQTSRIPRLVDDVRRGTVGGLIGVIAAVIAIIVLRIMGSELNFAQLVTVYFSGFIIAALALSVLPIIVFHRASGTQLADWMSATTPTSRRDRVLWVINGGGAVSWALSGSAAAIGAVITVAFLPELRQNIFVIVLAVFVVIASAFLIITSYAVRYAREDAVKGGIEIPGAEHPVFADYLYLAVQVATTFSTSDVVVTTTSMRRLVATNSLISFAFNTVIIALLVSVLLGSV